jgi:hypothetical protein
MGHAASIPKSEEEALAQGYTAKQIEEYKILVVELARRNALRALELRNQESRARTSYLENRSEGKEDTSPEPETKDSRK